MIFTYAYGRPFTNDTLPKAVRLWCTDRQAALRHYGAINEWDVSEVTSMKSLFSFDFKFNDCIDRWDVRNVRSMR
jgi:hypothetical protein